MTDVVFDEREYLAKYDDVAKAVASGDLLSGRQHFLKYGKAEGRIGYRFDARWYAEAYPAATEDVRNGKARNLRDHYERIGRHRGYLPHAPETNGTPVKAALDAFASAALEPILLSHIPRSGSTLLMDVLSRSPAIAVANHYPYEVRVATYYAHAYHVMTSLGDHAASGAPTEFMRQSHALSYDPFNHPEFGDVFSSPALMVDFFDRHAKEQSREFCYRMAIDYYKLLAVDRGKPTARYFAEKCELNFRFRAIFRQLFPATRELILVRDLRDIYCSYLRYFPTAETEQAATTVATAGHMILAIKEFDNDVLFLRYEDCILDPNVAGRKLGEFLGVPIEMTAIDARQLFSKHATSTSPAASIGRWRSDVTEPQKDAFQRASAAWLATFNDVFGYP